MNSQYNVTQLKDYTGPSCSINTINLEFDIRDSSTTVICEMQIEMMSLQSSLRLHGEKLKLNSLAINDIELTISEYALDQDGLVIHSVPDSFCLRVVTEIFPAENSELMGLYQSNAIFCTQCEAEGFRRITYYLDRPDVLSIFTTKIIANKNQLPVLLSNGNQIERGDLSDGRHFVIWHDPHPKPSYLFALVAGDLSVLKDEYVTYSNKTVQLAIYSEPENIEQCHHAMSSVKKAMRWDEEHYGREYDLEEFNIVAVNDFNFGAMENKGLNIFNAKYILADPALATDADYQNIDTVVAHEYFHNWSGNRVTLRDWFQLSLKEGFTVFREQSFDETIQSKSALRIARVSKLRDKQFAEDAGPNAHPIRPETYLKIDNFYTYTVYEKGSEVIRMLATLLGKDLFRQACDEYFLRFDGQAVTTDDFLAVMSDVSGLDLTAFKLWYSQAGTPHVNVTADFDKDAKLYRLMFEQTIPDTPGQLNKLPMVIPIRLGLLDQEGKELSLDGLDLLSKDVFVLDSDKKTLTVTGVKSEPIPSLLRHFSAPVKLNFAYTEKQLIHLIRYDSDGFSKFEAMQRFALSEIFHLMLRIRENKELSVSPDFVDVFKFVLTATYQDAAFHALLLTLPSEAYIAEQLEEADVDSIHLARMSLKMVLAKHCFGELKKLFVAAHSEGPYVFNTEQVGLRDLKNIVLSYLMLANADFGQQLAQNQFTASLGVNMTDCIAALRCLAHEDSLERVEALSAFHEKYQNNSLAMNKWLSAQALSRLPDTLESVKSLMNHACFDLTRPNDVYALLLGFTENRIHFHQKEGLGYQFIAEQVILLDKINPMVAARLVEPLTHWRCFTKVNQSLMKKQLQRILEVSELSSNVYELVSKSLSN